VEEHRGYNVSKHVGGLGKGLGALIPVSGQPAVNQAVAEVDVDDIEPNPHQPRQIFDPEAVAELTKSVREHGVLQPLLVTRVHDGDTSYQLIAGERRWTAAKLAGLTTVPVVIKEASPQQMLEIALVENIQRADLNSLEEAEAYRHLVLDFHLSQEQVAAKVGKSPAAVSNSLRLLGLSDAVKAALASGKIAETHARALLALTDPTLQAATLAEVIARGLSVRQTEELVRRILQGKKLNKGASRRPEQVEALQEDFRRALGTKVELFRSKRGGKLVIHFFNDDQLQGLYEHIIQDPH
jgi:ParB family chromosome partitioning protein